ncbi:MAG TPA: GNAT family N-acetyltransferase [Gemmataceae bacterium]|nr:GNAT family N-acetyltransferase [Gemmataceae bacterium]
MSDHLRAIAHRAMALAPSPWLRHTRTGKHAVRDGVVYVRQDYADPGFNFAAVLGPSPPLAKILAVAEDFYAALPGRYGILVEGDAGHPVEAELRAAGWQVAEDEPALVLPRIPKPLPAPYGLEIRKLTDPSDLRRQFEMLGAAFDTPIETMEKMMPPPSLLSDPDITVFAGICDGKYVSGGMSIRIDGIGTVHGVATLPSYRHRGFGRALTWAAVHEGAKHGCATAALRASGASFDMYRRMGFVHVCNHRTYAKPVASPAI